MKLTIIIFWLMAGSFVAGMELSDTLSSYKECKR